jgi:cytochrome c biogenesis protein CcmG, thiol:disulfide interchange protein DsbE
MEVRAARAAPGRRVRVVVVCAAAVAILAGVITLAATDQGSSTGYDTKPSAFVLPALDGHGKVALADFTGHPVVVNFFATWCSLCSKELPIFGDDAQALRGRVDFVEVNALETGNGGQFARRFDLSSKVSGVARDVGGSQGDGLYQALGGSGGLPMTAFYNAKGKVVYLWVGGYDASSLAAALDMNYGIKVRG